MAVQGAPVANAAATGGSWIPIAVAAMLAMLIVLALIWLLMSEHSKAASTDPDLFEDDAKYSAKTKKPKAKVVERQKEKVVAPPSPPVPEVPAVPLQEEEMVSKPSKKKKKRKSAASKEVNEENSDEAEEPSLSPDQTTGAISKDEDEEEAPTAGDAVDEPQIADGWTAVPKKREKDEAEQKRTEKVQDLRRRKATISQQIKRLEQGLGSGSSTGGKDGGRERGDCKALEARERLLDDLNRVNMSIQRLLAANAAARCSSGDAEDTAEVSATIGEGADVGDAGEEEAWGQRASWGNQRNGEWADDYSWEVWDDYNWEDWETGGQDWQASWHSGRGRGRPRRSRGRGRGGNGQWEGDAPGEFMDGSQEAAGEAGDEEWQQDWWEGGAQGGSAWMDQGAAIHRRRGRRGGNRYQGAAGWWESAESWEAAAGSATGSTWHGGAEESWAGEEWTEDADAGAEAYYQQSAASSWSAEPRKRERRKRGRGRGAERGDWNESEKVEGDEEAVDMQEDAASPDAVEASAEAAACYDEPHRTERRREKGKGSGKGGKKGKDFGKSKPDDPTMARGAGGASAPDRRPEEQKQPNPNDRSVEDWLRARGLKPRAKEDLPESLVAGSGSQVESKADEATMGSRTSDMSALAFMAGSRSGKRTAWGDAESSDEESPVSRRGRADSKGSDQHSTGAASAARPSSKQSPIAAAQPAEPSSKQSHAGMQRQHSTEASEQGTEESSWDEDLVAFMGEDALRDDAQFEEQLKYVPKWVAEKALRRRRQLMRPMDN